MAGQLVTGTAMIGDAGRARHEDQDLQLATAQPSGASPAQGHPLRRVESVALLAGAREIEIAHRGELYRLRCTSKGKLILTK